MKKRTMADAAIGVIDKKLTDGKACHRLLVPKNCCSLDFVTRRQREGKYAYSVMGCERFKGTKKVWHEFETVRGEQVFIDVDKHNRILSIELIDSPAAKKPCMRGGRK